MFRLLLTAVLCTFSLSSCAVSSLNTDIKYYKDVVLREGGSTYKGVGTLQSKTAYSFEIEADEAIDILFLQTNHREVIVEKPRDGKVFNKKKVAKVSLKPNSIEEGSLLFVTALNRSKGKHSWGLFALPSKADKVCKVLCNGSTLRGKDIVCQAKVGTKVRLLTLGDMVNKEDECSYKEPDFTVKPGICGRVVLDKNNKYCRLYIYGYEEFVVRQ